MPFRGRARRGSRVRFPKEERCAESPPTFICGKRRKNRRKPVKKKILSSGVVFTFEEVITLKKFIPWGISRGKGPLKEGFQVSSKIADKSSNNFGANTKNNPKEECKAVMTRSKRFVEAEDEENMVDKEQLSEKIGAEVKKNDVKEKSRSGKAVEESVEVPYLVVPSKKEKDRHLARKHKYIHQENIIVEGNCSAVIQKILPPKHKDLRSVTIPCSIGEVNMGKALIDMGASINLMPLSMCRRLGELEIMPTRMTLQLADCSITMPYGVIEDVLVRVKHFIFPADVVVMDISEDIDIPVVLGRPFMLTASCIVDMGKRKLELGFEDQKIDFDLFVEDKPTLEHNVCLQVIGEGQEVLKMSSRKRNSVGSRPTAQYDTWRFHSFDAWTRYTDNVLRRHILAERKVEIYHTKLDEFKGKLKRRNFHKPLTNLADSSIDLALVKEFYANLYSPEGPSPKQVRIRRHLIRIDADNLNAFLETPVVLAEGEFLPAYSRYCRMPTDNREIEAALCIPSQGFILNAEGHPGKILRKDLTTLAQVWSVLSYSNLAPTSHTSDLTVDQARLIFGLVTQLDMNVEALISGQITSMAQSNSSRLSNDEDPAAQVPHQPADESSESSILEPLIRKRRVVITQEAATTPEKSLEATPEPPEPIEDTTSPQQAADPSTPEDQTTPVQSPNASLVSTPVLHLTDKEEV
ncbi:hypothetical protein HKD37_03G007229 [Glycine soja]